MSSLELLDDMIPVTPNDEWKYSVMVKLNSPYYGTKQQNKELAKISQTLWPQRSDDLQRVFAMGYDSMYLVDKVKAMQKRPYIRHFGQTSAFVHVLKNHEIVILFKHLHLYMALK